MIILSTKFPSVIMGIFRIQRKMTSTYQQKNQFLVNILYQLKTGFTEIKYKNPTTPKQFFE